MRVSDKPQRAPCPACGVDTFVGWRDGILETVWTDPVALTALGELQAVTLGRETFCHWGGPSGALDTRWAASIARWPAGTHHNPIRPEHRCGAAPLDHFPDRRLEAPTDPPF